MAQNSLQHFPILGDPGAVSGDGEKSKTGEEKKEMKAPPFDSDVIFLDQSQFCATQSNQ